MPAGVEIGLLGPLQVRRDGVTVAVPAGKQRALLAALLLQAGRPVPADELAELLWAPNPPPPTAPVALRNNVTRLRRVLGPAGQHLIVTRPGGYVITPGECELDLARMEQELAAARAAARDGDWHQAAAHADASLSLWRGEPLSDVDLPALATQHVPRLNEMRLQARELRIEADLALARHAEAVTELPQLIAANPVRERLYALLMLALYRCGRRAEALDAYRAAHDVLAGEVGANPGPELRALQQQILHDDPALAAPTAAGTRARQPPRAPQAAELPRQLPAAVACFTGRDAELAALTSLLGPAQGTQASALVISAIGGTAGVGKTALAVQWAHQVAGHFPDGQLYANLRGYDPGQPTPAADVLAGFLRTLGVPGAEIPDEIEERARLYRSKLAGRRLLVLLDNARDGDQVRSLLPGDPGCVAVVTSRDALAGLVARDGAARLDLDVLPLADAIILLRALIGPRADKDPDATAELAGLCARLPLALRIAAELAAAQPAVPLAALAGELADQQRRLDLLDAGGDPRTAVRAVFSWSYDQLHCDAARAFLLAALHPGADFDTYGVAALTGTSLGQTSRLLGQLARAHLMQPAGPGRHGMHDLLRAYARELAAAQDCETERQAGLTRVFDYYLHAAAAAMDILFPAERHRRPPPTPSPGTPAQPLTDPAAARTWLDTELTSMVAVAAHTAGHGWPGHATRLSATLFRYLDTCGHYPEAIIIHTHAVSAARCTGDRAAEAEALTSLGVGQVRQGRYQPAAGHLQQALALYRDSGDRPGQARALHNLGTLSMFQGRYQQATGHFTQALDLYHDIGDRTNEGHALATLGHLDLRQGRYQQAAGRLRQALAMSRGTGDRPGEAHALINLGLVAMLLGRYQQAASRLRQAVTLSRQTGDRAAEAYALAGRGDLDVRRGRYEQAASNHQRALSLFREIGDESGEAQAHNSLGELHLAMRQPGHARTQHAAALTLASQVGDTYEQARAHHGLARAHQAHDDADQARRHWQQALTLYTELGAPEADQIRAQLGAPETDQIRDRLRDSVQRH